jgi:chromate transport protein ChrA
MSLAAWILFIVACFVIMVVFLRAYDYWEARSLTVFRRPRRYSSA